MEPARVQLHLVPPACEEAPPCLTSTPQDVLLPTALPLPTSTNDTSPEAKPQAKNARTPAQIVNDVIWDACIEALGYEPKTASEKSNWGKMVQSLRSAEADPDRIKAVAKWYRKSWPAIDLTITALEKWYSHFLAMEVKRTAIRAACPECEMGGGHHVAGCSLS